MPPTPEQTREAHFRGLYAEHYDAVSRFVRRRGSPSDVDDIVAETFLVAWRRLEDVPTGPGEALPWLYAVARNCLLNAARSHVRQHSLAVKVADHDPTALSDRAFDEGAAADDRVDLANAWRQLSPEDQEVLGLALFEDLTSTAAARVIGTSPSAYRLRLSRARRRLRALLSPATPTPQHAVAPAANKERT